MPKRTDLKHVLVIGSGPIVIGQACEFDYSGTQACRVLRSEGIRVSLVNSNPATIMTDPEFADATYVEPITPEFVELVIAKERPDAILPTLGGQTALNTAVALHEARRAGEVRRRADRREHRRDQPGRGPAAVQGDRREGRRTAGPGRSDRAGAALAGLPLDGRGPRDGRRAGPAGGHPAVVHHGRPGFRHGAHRRGPGAHRRRRPGGQPGARGAHRGERARLEGVRARADARPARQRGGGLLDRERRPDGRAHRRQRHRRAGDDAHRPGVPAAA